jgi:hypothetical protein
MKPHIQREMNNELRDIAIKHHAHECLREIIAKCTHKYLDKQSEWEREEWALEQKKLMQGLPCLPIDREAEYKEVEDKVNSLFKGE